MDSTLRPSLSLILPLSPHTQQRGHTCESGRILQLRQLFPPVILQGAASSKALWECSAALGARQQGLRLAPATPQGNCLINWAGRFTTGLPATWRVCVCVRERECVYTSESIYFCVHVCLHQFLCVSAGKFVHVLLCAPANLYISWGLCVWIWVFVYVCCVFAILL